MWDSLPMMKWRVSFVFLTRFEEEGAMSKGDSVGYGDAVCDVDGGKRSKSIRSF